MFGIDWLDPAWIVEQSGDTAMWVVAGILFAECGLLIGFLFPGDTLLFSLGVLAAGGALREPIWLIAVVLTVAAILGNVCGYELGRAIGPPLFRHAKLLREVHVQQAEEFFDRHGAPAIILARFVGIVRTVITVVAGIAGMPRRRYLVLSTIGAIPWAAGITLAGYFLGRIPVVQRWVMPHLELLILSGVAAAVLPLVIHGLRDRRRRERRSVGPAENQAETEPVAAQTSAVSSGPASERMHNGN